MLKWGSYISSISGVISVGREPWVVAPSQSCLACSDLADERVYSSLLLEDLLSARRRFKKYTPIGT